MNEPKLIFNETLYSTEEINAMAAEFRETGFVVLPEVFKRETVPGFKAQLEELMFHNGTAYTLPDDCPHYIHAALAPRGRPRATSTTHIVIERTRCLPPERRIVHAELAALSFLGRGCCRRSASRHDGQIAPGQRPVGLRGSEPASGG